MDDIFKPLSNFESIKDPSVESAYKRKLSELCDQVNTIYGSVVRRCESVSKSSKPVAGNESQPQPAASGPSRPDDNSDDSED